MPDTEKIIAFLSSQPGKEIFFRLYGRLPDVLSKQNGRYRALLQRFSALFPQHTAVELFSAPGRTEVGGNHTDHNAGRVLAAAVDVDIIAAVATNHAGLIRIYSEPYPPILLSIEDLAPIEDEKFTSHALVRGICARFRQLGYAIGGFDAVLSSQVPKGSGLSSSAAFEMLVGVILNQCFNQGRLEPLSVAQIGQFAENHYFGKPSGLMDQIACAVGGLVTIDFQKAQQPVIQKVEYDFSASGYSLVIVEPWGDHSDLNEEYAAIAGEMKAVARALGGRVLREFSEAAVWENLPYLRTQVNDRAVLRAVHFFREDQRVVEQVAALQANDIERFLGLVHNSGLSSWMLLQNCYSNRHTESQGISVALTASQTILKWRGAWRVHGGGFAGTIQVFVPVDLLFEYIMEMEKIFGAGSCHVLRVRPDGALKLTLPAE